MKFIKKYKKWLINGIILFAVNQSFPYIAGGALTTTYSSSIKIEQIDYSKRKNLPSNFSSLDYLNLSNFMSFREGEGDGDCKDCALATYGIYKNLIKLNNRSDLEDKIRFVAGEILGGNRIYGHAWVEIKRKNTWEPYETAIPTIVFFEDIKSIGELNLNKFKVLSRHMATYPGTYTPLPTKDIINPLKGAIPAIINQVKK